MAGRHSTGEARDDALLDVDDFNVQYDALVGRLNGGIDRAASTSGWVTKPKLADYALQKVAVNTAIELASGLQTSGTSGTDFDCMEYDSYSGGWYTNSSYSITGVKPGVLHVEFSTCCYMLKYQTARNPKSIRWRLQWDGQTVAETGEWWSQFCNPYINVDFPVAGDGTLSLDFAYPPSNATYDTSSAPQLYFWGGQILTRGVWR